MQPSNVIMGDENSGIDLPEFQPPQEEIKEIRSMANHAKSPEYQRLVEWCEAKIAFYQGFMPNGLAIDKDYVPTTEDWRVANRVIADLKEFMGVYEYAKEQAKELKNV
jgi:hypothetical protein